MNKRIQKLADEAAKYSAIMALPTGQSGNELFVEKFAELIVRECINACESHDIESFGILPIRAVMVTKSCQNNIKEHFGVEL